MKLLQWIKPLLEWRRTKEAVKMVLSAKGVEQGKLHLLYPPIPWYEMHATEMLRLLHKVMEQLECATGLSFSEKIACFVTTPQQAEIINQGAAGRVYKNVVVVGVYERQISELIQIAAHEFAHSLSYRLGEYEVPFKGEGFACYAAAAAEIDLMPMGLPLHYYPKWLLASGVQLLLGRLWQRKDYSPELYDLAWSFAHFLCEQFGAERYYAFYAATGMDFSERCRKFFGHSALALQELWSEYVWEQVDKDPSEIREMSRYTGRVCGRAFWLGKVS